MTPQMLSCAEALLLAHLGALPEPHRSVCLGRLATPAVNIEHCTEDFLQRLAPLRQPWHRRASSVHPTWVEQALKGFPSALHTRVRVWLSEGIAPEEVIPVSQRWLALRCMATFPLGPIHLEGVAPQALGHPGRLALLPQSALVEVLGVLGLNALSLTLHRADRRSVAGVLAALPEAHRSIVLEALKEGGEAWPNLRLRMQEAVLRFGSTSVDVSELGAHLGLRILALACADRFHLEGRFLAVRLPYERGRILPRLLPGAARRPAEEAEQARVAAEEWLMRGHVE